MNWRGAENILMFIIKIHFQQVSSNSADDRCNNLLFYIFRSALFSKWGADCSLCHTARCFKPDDFWPWAEAVQVPEPDLRTNTEPCLDLFMVLQKRTQPTLILEIRLFTACRGTQKHENTHISIWQRLKSHKEILKTKSQRNFWHTRINWIWSDLVCGVDVLLRKCQR